MEEEVKNGQTAADAATVSDKENFNDNLHGENLTDRAKVLSPGMTVLKRFFRSKLSVIGLVVLIALFLFSFIGPLFSPWGANEADPTPNTIFTVSTINYDIGGESYICFDLTLDQTQYNNLGGISPEHIMGTDNSAFDVFTRLMKGGQVSLTIGFVVVILETLLGVLLGGLAGYFGKWVDQLIMRVVDVLSCIPTLPILLILSSIFTQLGIVDISKLYYMMIVLTLLGWTSVARLVRGQILSLREQEFMLAAKSSGLSTAKKIFKHLLPNVIPQLIVFMTLGLGSIILYEATLGYLGIGAPLGTATWGNLINLASDATYRNYYPNLWLGSGICITLAILAFNFVGDGLRDAFDPKMKR
ncbi:MAG: ABC transporter permease [Clostridia bacterium]|nr:ABC transporter permease [Clostridia bacterium]